MGEAGAGQGEVHHQGLRAGRPSATRSATQGTHPIACEAAAAGAHGPRRTARPSALEDWIFANQATLTLDGLKQAVRDIGGVADFDAQYPRVLDDVKVDTSLGGFLGVHVDADVLHQRRSRCRSLQPECWTPPSPTS